MSTFRAGRLLVLSTVIAVLLPAVPAYAAFDTFITITGSRQGQFKGDAGSDQIRLVSVVRDTPMETAMHTGRSTHSTITITKEIDKASPRFAQALSTNEVLSEVVINFEGASGGAKTAQKIVLTNAKIISVRKAGGSEMITLDYQAIEVTWTDGGKTMADDWQTPR
ncbi:MAG: type VI secretion system tube protein TssD [Terracidiphilus sp.]